MIRSTLPVGSTSLVREWSSVGTDRTFTNPEFLRQGTAYGDFLNPTRVVIGQFPDADPDARAVVLGALEPIPGPRLLVSVAEAELIKNAANGFLGLRLSYVNELAALCEEYGADVGAVLEGTSASILASVASTCARASVSVGVACPKSSGRWRTPAASGGSPCT